MWIALAVLAVLLLSSMLSSAGGYKGVDTAKSFAALNDNQVKSAKLVGGDEPHLDLTLKDGVKIDGSNKIRSEIINGSGNEVQNLLRDKADAGQLSALSMHPRA